jgi:S-methylmethionine-dependent homocysteine/selenocysteine methylase
MTQVATAKYRHRILQLEGGSFVTDGGIETTLIYREGLDLPLFAAFHLYQTPEGSAALERYFRRYAEMARSLGVGCVLESATWRASADWGARLGYSPASLAEANRKAIDQLAAIRAELETPQSPMVISGCVGPRGDGYVPDQRMSAEAARAYHARQVGTFADTEADLVTAITMNYVEEAIGIARAAGDNGLPVVLSFTVETDGRLPTGQPLGEAIEEVDATTGRAPAYYMVNCAHPDHFREALGAGSAWAHRIGGLRANASRQSHAELNEATTLDSGDPSDFARQHRSIQRLLPNLHVYGGCCGTDERHIEALATACL